MTSTMSARCCELYPCADNAILRCSLAANVEMNIEFSAPAVSQALPFTLVLVRNFIFGR